MSWLQTQSLVIIDPSKKLWTGCFVEISIWTNSSVGRATVSEITADIKISGFESNLVLIKVLKIILRARFDYTQNGGRIGRDVFVMS